MKSSKKPNVRRAMMFINPQKKRARDMKNEIIRELASLDIQTDTFPFDRNSTFCTEKKDCDIVVCLGGDGTVLYAARSFSPHGVPIFPINLGTFGFIAGVSPDEWKQEFSNWLSGKAAVSQRLMFEITVERDGEEILKGRCLNDIVVSASGIAKIISLNVCCGADSRANGAADFSHLASYRCDGLIIATPTGSTAHSVAAGGPILDPELEAVILNPICPFTLSHRPMVLSARETFLVEVEHQQRSGVILTIDGQISEKLKGGDRIYLKKAPYRSLLVSSGSESFFKALKTKLAWSGGSEEAPFARRA
ncbi:MAG: NAD(+)/NADH kinase [Treponema sp.]|nr:NAD(+)/NADH kinase [Treponema sp.]